MATDALELYLRRGAQVQLCATCGGTGHVVIGEHFVTRDMAIDAGDAQLEGMSFGVEYGCCPECNGTGQAEETCA